MNTECVCVGRVAIRCATSWEMSRRSSAFEDEILLRLSGVKTIKKVSRGHAPLTFIYSLCCLDLGLRGGLVVDLLVILRAREHAAGDVAHLG